MFEARIKEMISSCAAESWESWHEEAVKYLEEKNQQIQVNDNSSATSLVSAQRQRSSVENTFEIDRGSSDSEAEDGGTADDLTDLSGFQQLFNEFFSAINTIEEYGEPNVRTLAMLAAARTVTDTDLVWYRAFKWRL